MENRIGRVPKRSFGVRGVMIAVAILAVLALTIPTMTSAHRKGWDVFFSTVQSWSEGGTSHIRGSIFVEVTFHPKEACIPHRPIRLYEVVPGADRLLGSGKTDRNGAFQFSFPGGEEDRNLALKLLRKVIKKDGRHLHFCEEQTATFES
jgi:hypothetical protein